MGGMTNTTSEQLSPTGGSRITLTSPLGTVATEYDTVREIPIARSAHSAPEVAVPVKLPKHVATLALAIYREMSASYAEYEAACEQDHRNGYTAHYCEHGTNHWTDYDNICGACEDGYTLSTPMARRVEALRAAKGRHAAAMAMLKWASAGSDHGLYTPAFQEAVFARYASLMGVA